MLWIMSFWYGSESADPGSGSCSFRQWPSRRFFIAISKSNSTISAYDGRIRTNNDVSGSWKSKNIGILRMFWTDVQQPVLYLRAAVKGTLLAVLLSTTNLASTPSQESWPSANAVPEQVQSHKMYKYSLTRCGKPQTCVGWNLTNPLVTVIYFVTWNDACLTPFRPHVGMVSICRFFHRKKVLLSVPYFSHSSHTVPTQ